MNVRVEAFEPGRWEGLYRDLPSATPFQSPSWVRAWAETYRPRSVAQIEVWEGGELAAVAAVVRLGAVLRLAATGPSDLLAPLARTPEARAALWEACVRLAPIVEWAEQPVALAPTDGWDQSVRLLIDLPPTFDGYLQTLNKSLRYDARGLNRHGCRVERGGGADAFERFLDLHRARWRTRRLPGAFVGRRATLHHRWLADRPPEAELLTLWRESDCLGVLYLMKTPATWYFYQLGFTPAASRISPGSLLTATAIRLAIESGAQTFDMLRGDEPYKRRWKPTREERQMRCVFAPSPLGRLLLPQLRQAHQWERRLRARLENGVS